jgi:hypothetical protein
MNQSDLLKLLAEIIDFLEDQADAEFDSNGNLIGNAAMKLYGRCDGAYQDIELSGVDNDI